MWVCLCIHVVCSYAVESHIVADVLVRACCVVWTVDYFELTDDCFELQLSVRVCLCKRVVCSYGVERHIDVGV